MSVLELVKLLNQQSNYLSSIGHTEGAKLLHVAADKLEELQEYIYQLENKL